MPLGSQRRSPNAELFELAFEEAIENAVIHTTDTTPEIQVTVQQDHPSDRVGITVADTGPGIPDHERETIAAGEEMPLAHGSGIGLWLMEWITTNLGGEFGIQDTTPQGTILTFELPVVNHPELETAEEFSR